MQSHIRILEASPENRAALLLGLEYLTGISFVDDTEVFKVMALELYLDCIKDSHKVVYLMMANLQVCLDYWNIFVLELFEAHNQIEPATAAVSMMGLQVVSIGFFCYL
jgi:exportin-1